MPLSEEEENQLRIYLERVMLLNKFQRDKFVTTLNKMLSLFDYRKGQNVLTLEGIAVWRIYPPAGPSIPPTSPSGTEIPLNQVMRMAA